MRSYIFIDLGWSCSVSQYERFPVTNQFVFKLEGPKEFINALQGIQGHQTTLHNENNSFNYQAETKRKKSKNSHTTSPSSYCIHKIKFYKEIRLLEQNNYIY